MKDTTDFCYVAVYGHLPVAVAHNLQDIQLMLLAYAYGKSITFEPYNPKWPDALEGWYTVIDDQNEEVKFRLYATDYADDSK